MLRQSSAVAWPSLIKVMLVSSYKHSFLKIFAFNAYFEAISRNILATGCSQSASSLPSARNPKILTQLQILPLQPCNPPKTKASSSTKMHRLHFMMHRSVPRINIQTNWQMCGLSLVWLPLSQGLGPLASRSFYPTCSTNANDSGLYTP